MKNTLNAVAALSIATLLQSTVSLAHAYTLEPRQEGNITYITGGIGDEERNALNAVKNDYNLSIVSTTRSGAYVGDTNVVISDRNGDQVLDAQAGPLFYAQLPPGRYVVEGDSHGQTYRKNVTIAENTPTHLQFTWK